MITHRFAEAARRRDGAAMAALFAQDVTYHTPTLTTDLHGRDLTLRYLAAGTRIVDDLEYTDQVSDDERLILFWTGILDRREISGATVLADEAGGLIRDITVLQRPWGVTVLTLGSTGLIDNVALHHRPLGGVLAFSAELGRRLGNSLGPGVFYPATQASR